MLQRAKPFKPFKFFLDAIDPDRLPQLVGLQLLQDLWVRGESACCAHHVTGNTLAPFPDTPAKDVLMTVALYDQQVTTLGAQLAAATRGLPNLEGSVLLDRPLVPVADGPVDSAHVVYDTGSYQLGVHDDLIPPLANQPAARDDNRCDPHGLRAFIPASLTQLAGFLEGDGIQNFCDGPCDAAVPAEQPEGGPVCEP